MTEQFLLVLLLVAIGSTAGYVFRMAIALTNKKTAEQKLEQKREEAEQKARLLLKEAETKAEQLLYESKIEAKELRATLQQTEQRLTKKENILEAKQAELDQEERQNKDFRTALENIKKMIMEKEAAILRTLETVSHFTSEQAKEELFSRIEKQAELDLLQSIQKLEKNNQAILEDRARDILATAVQRYAASTAQDLTTTSIPISSEEMKGKIIGKEGRNIRSFERAAGVELIVDDTPGAIVISSFDPIRRQIARLALENLLLDGRIQPAKIEEFVETAKHDINKIIKTKGEEAVYELGIIDLDPRIVAILGRLHFRTSYGQNVLQHSIEMAHIAGLLAEEIGANVSVAKTGALVHDIGKALDHEMPGGHVKIGMRILEKFGADQKVIDAMKSHHDDWPHASVEAVLVQAADNISGGRPGARRDSVENYIKRLEELENVANAFVGVEKSYALQAGREIRVFVSPEAISDLQAKNLARNLADKIQTDLRYPGEIKVTVIRESRVIEFAR